MSVGAFLPETHHRWQEVLKDVDYSRDAPRIFWGGGGGEHKFAYVVASRVREINLTYAFYHSSGFLGCPT